MLSPCFLQFSEGVRVFVIGLSHISSFFSSDRKEKNITVPADKTANNFTLFCKSYIVLFQMSSRGA